MERPNKPFGREHSRAYLGAGTERASAGAGAGESGDARGPGGSAPGASDGGEGRPNGSRCEERLHQSDVENDGGTPYAGGDGGYPGLTGIL